MAIAPSASWRISRRPPKWGVTLAPDRQGLGLATEALGAIVSTLFEVHYMHRVFGEVDDRNTAVQNLFGRLGFRCESRQIEADWFKGEWTTVRVYAMLECEWRAGGRSSAERTAGLP
ncbi:MAG: GNAT family protein [Solirubrobacteraceae bacterium]